MLTLHIHYVKSVINFTNIMKFLFRYRLTQSTLKTQMLQNFVVLYYNTNNYIAILLLIDG